MTILWIIALFLAIPTYGISIIVAIILSFMIIKTNYETCNEIQTLESYSRINAINTILAKERISTKLSHDFLYELYGLISTEINTELKHLPLDRRTDIIIMAFTKIILESNDDIYTAMMIKDIIIKNAINKF